MNQLEIRSSTNNRAEIFTRSVSLQDYSSLKISAQKDHLKCEIVSEGEALNGTVPDTTTAMECAEISSDTTSSCCTSLTWAMSEKLIIVSI